MRLQRHAAEAGAEKLKTLFQLGFTVKDKDVRELGEGHREVEITLQFTHLPTGWLLGHGVGSANTFERRMQREKGGPWDVYNTCLKIAKRRALVDRILTVTGSSGLLTQDIEEDPALYQDRHQSARRPLPQAPRPHPNGNGNGHQPAQPELVTGFVSRVWENVYQGKRYYMAKLDKGQQIQTTDAELGSQLLGCETGEAFRAWCEPSPTSGKFYLKSFSEATAEAQA